MNNRRVLWLISLVLLVSGCNKTSVSPEVADEIVEVEPELPPPPKQVLPPGEPGPFVLQMNELLPTQVFGSAATPDFFSVALQGDVRDITRCTQTQLTVCFKGGAYITERMNPNEAKFVQLYESDTQSGARIDDLVATNNRFIYAISDGIYAGDTRNASLVVVDTAAKVDKTIALNVADQIIDQVALVAGDEDYVACTLSHAEQGHSPSQIRCEQFLGDGSRQTLFIWSFDVQPRSFDVARLDQDLLITWTAGAKLYAAFSDEPQNIMELGTATATRPALAAGHKQFMLAWQDAETQTRVVRLVRGEAPSQSLVLNGLTYRSIGGFVPTVPGFVLAFRFENAQQLAVIEPDLSAWNLVEGSKTWRQLSGYAAIDIQEAHQGKILWQTADSLITAN